MGKIWLFFKKWFFGWGYRVAKTAIKEEAEALYDIALKIVTDVSWDKIATGDQKFSDAYAQMIAIVAVEELQHGVAAIRIAIEDMHAVAVEEKLGGYANDD